MPIDVDENMIAMLRERMRQPKRRAPRATDGDGEYRAGDSGLRPVPGVDPDQLRLPFNPPPSGLVQLAREVTEIEARGEDILSLLQRRERE